MSLILKTIIMKTIILIIKNNIAITAFLLLSLIVACANTPSSEVHKKAPPPPPSTLDSLQGVWVNDEDPQHQVTISGRDWTEKYLNPSAPFNETYRIYFSDTLVDNDLLFTAIRIDTLAVSGQYIIRASPDQTIDCDYLNGFYRDSTDTTFSITPREGGIKETQLFKKLH